jgi:2'-hydroxyisoflavone reductase
MVREALRRGHKVTLFNRGKTNNAMFPDLETIKGDRNNGLDGLKGRSWDAVIDNSGYVPRHVQDSARMLAPNTSRYLFISSVSVYKDFTVDNSESSVLGTMADETIEQVNGETYGALKALCEKRAGAEIGADKLTVIRPTYIAGPGDHTDRFSYWPIRTRKGGEMIWPGTASDVIQVVDVRDLANFTVDCLDKDIAGTFNTANRERAYSIGQLLEDSQAVTSVDVDPLWISEEFAYEKDLVDGRVLPIWHPRGGEQAVQGAFVAEAARSAGFRSRPERETIRDLLAWWDTLSTDRQANIKAGIPADKEAELIAAWKAQA